MTKLAEQCVRKEGVTFEGYQILEKNFQTDLPKLNYRKSIVMKDVLIDFVKAQGSVCQKDERLLGSSEIIESVFGKQKYLKYLERDYKKEGHPSFPS